MPVIKSKMRALKKKYGAEKGERIYYALEQKEKSKKKRGKHKSHRKGSSKRGRSH